MSGFLMGTGWVWNDCGNWSGPGADSWPHCPPGNPPSGGATAPMMNLRKVFPETAVIHWFRKDNRVGTWSPSTADAVAKLVYREPRGNLPVEAVAFVICEKR
jgi:hypothetical protein